MKNFISLSIILISSAAVAADPAAPKSTGAVEVDVEAVKEKYWAGGEKQELGVVQNRTYTKSRKLTLGVLGGITASDPFLSIYTLGFSTGYYFSEEWGIQVIGWKSLTKPSNALETLRDQGKDANTNNHYGYVGAEVAWSLMYGKLSLLRSSIVYYDFYLMAGGGMTWTETGNYITPHAGVGQRFYVSKKFSVKLDYRMMVFKENLVEKVITSKLGQSAGSRLNYSNSIVLGVDYLIDF